MSELYIPETATWIGSEHPFDLHETYLNFRSPHTFCLERLPQAAELYITADSRYKLWINGQFLARGPARSWPQSQCVDRLDVAPYLRTGLNGIAVQVYQPGYSHFSYVHRGAGGLLAWLICDGQPVLVTDTSWRVRRDASFSAQVQRVSIYGSGVEDRDLALADGWHNPDYGADGWAAPRIVAAINGYPWTGLRLRSLPHMVEHTQILMKDSGPARQEHAWSEDAPSVPLPVQNVTLLEIRRGSTPKAPDPHLALRQGWRTATPTTTVVADEGGVFEVNLEAGQSLYWLYDLGQDYTCQGWAEIVGASGQESLVVSYQEKIREGELVLSDPATYCRVRITDRFRLRAGDQTAETFALRGGRYLLFQVTGPAVGLRLRYHVRVAHYPLHVTHRLDTGDPELDAIITLCERTFHACLQETFVDCVWRESSQWLGDALPQALIMASMSDDLRPLRTVIEMAAQGAYPDGILPGILPGEVHAYTVVDYNFTWIELLKLYFARTGDSDFVAAQWPTLVKMLERFQSDVAEDSLIRNQPGRRLFLDRSPQSRGEPSAVYNFRYLWGMQVALALAADWGGAQAGFIETTQRQCEELHRALRRVFWHDRRWWDDPKRSTFSQLAASFAVLTGAARADEQDAILDAIAARSLDPNDDPTPGQMILASPFMHHYIFEALRKGGRQQDVIDIIRLRWGRWIQDGYPTCWENWSVDFPDGSQCHAFSAHPRYHLAQVLAEEAGSR